MEAVDTWIEYMRSFLDAPEARTLIVVHNLSHAAIALLMVVSRFEISGFTFSVISFTSKNRLSYYKTKA